jgi:hypothetical protein
MVTRIRDPTNESSLLLLFKVGAILLDLLLNTIKDYKLMRKGNIKKLETHEESDSTWLPACRSVSFRLSGSHGQAGRV